MPRSAYGVAVVVSSLVLATASLGQAPSPCPVMATGVMIYSSYVKTSPPFSATIQTTYEQKLADGNAIHGLIVTHEYRDSAGRMRIEDSSLCRIGLDGRLHPAITVMVDDPVNHVHMSWQVDGTGPKVVRLIHQPSPQSAPAAPRPLPTDEQRKIADLTEAHWRQNTRHEQLGTRMIAGFLTEGSRQITTTPAGEQGNDKPLENSTEVWIAKDTGIALLNIHDDPRNGRTTQEVTELTLAEPDPSLFTPPADYKIEEQTVR